MSSAVAIMTLAAMSSRAAKAMPRKTLFVMPSAFLLCVCQFEPSLDAFDALFQTIEARVYARKSLFDRGHANLDILQIVRHPCRPLVKPTQVDQDCALGLFRHRVYSAATRTGSG